MLNPFVAHLTRTTVARPCALLFLAIVCLIGTSTPAYSDTLVTLINPGNGSGYDFPPNATIGYSFRTPSGTPRRAISLGVWDENNNGLTSAVDVGLWANGGALLGSLTIPVGAVAPLASNFRYANLSTPIQLAPNSVYVLGAFRHSGVSYLIDHQENTAFAVASGFDILEERASSQFGGEPAMVYPGFPFDANQAFLGPNMIFNLVPEPATLLYVAIAAITTFTGRCRRRLPSEQA
jgi:hypothetical protein